MLTINKNILMIKIKEIHFSDSPYDINSCDFVKFCYCKNKINKEGFRRQKEITSVIDLTQDLDTIWNNMNRKSTRYGIKKAEKDGIIVKINERHDEFLKMYNSFLKNIGLRSKLELLRIKKLTVEDIKKYGTLFIAEYNNEIITGTLFLEDDSHIEAWLGGSKRFEVDNEMKRRIAYANRLIDWEMIKYAKGKGIKEYDLGGLWSDEEAEGDSSKRGINEFKLSFGGNIVTRYSYEKIYSKPYRFFYKLYTLRNSS